MKAEQRSSIRKKISLSIVINSDQPYSKRWKVRNLSLNDAMVKMRRDELLPGTPVEAVLALKEHDDYGLHRLRGGGARGLEWRGIAVSPLR